ncbi:hypothetical protein L208DRAFT_1383271 [Tricholoma matsutake]|nr:hypothetical protein L208DRAFT_1383271 [Tricholoma matsutake 945]
MADKDFLETCFPSLRENVVPVEKYSDLEPLIIPSDIQISILKSTNKINAAMQSILQLLPDDDTKGVVVAALDSEWNVEVSEHGFVTGQGQTAVLQIAVGKHIYVIQSTTGWKAASSYSEAGLMQSTNPKGWAYLQKACGSASPFLGGIDLGKFAKDRLAVKSVKIGLADLCAEVVGKRLDKNISEHWKFTMFMFQGPSL